MVFQRVDIDHLLLSQYNIYRKLKDVEQNLTNPQQPSHKNLHKYN